MLLEGLKAPLDDPVHPEIANHRRRSVPRSSVPAHGADRKDRYRAADHPDQDASGAITGPPKRPLGSLTASPRWTTARWPRTSKASLKTLWPRTRLCGVPNPLRYTAVAKITALHRCRSSALLLGKGLAQLPLLLFGQTRREDLELVALELVHHLEVVFSTGWNLLPRWANNA